MEDLDEEEMMSDTSMPPSETNDASVAPFEVLKN